MISSAHFGMQGATQQESVAAIKEIAAPSPPISNMPSSISTSGATSLGNPPGSRAGSERRPRHPGSRCHIMQGSNRGATENRVGLREVLNSARNPFEPKARVYARSLDRLHGEYPRGRNYHHLKRCITATGRRNAPPDDRLQRYPVLRTSRCSYSCRLITETRFRRGMMAVPKTSAVVWSFPNCVLQLGLGARSRSRCVFRQRLGLR